MGLKVSTLALYSITGKKVIVHATGEKAKVLVTWNKGGPSYRLQFDDGRIEDVFWSQDMQGHVVAGSELQEVEDSAMVSDLAPLIA